MESENRRRQTPLEVALRNRHQRVVELIQSQAGGEL